jgi:hypothetical protein
MIRRKGISLSVFVGFIFLCTFVQLSCTNTPYESRGAVLDSLSGAVNCMLSSLRNTDTTSGNEKSVRGIILQNRNALIARGHLVRDQLSALVQDIRNNTLRSDELKNYVQREYAAAVHFIHEAEKQIRDRQEQEKERK